MMADRSTMITTLAGTAIAMISVSVERGSLTGGEEDVEAVGEDVGEDISEEEEEEDLRAEIHEAAASDRCNR